jgi:hypothetical protein
MRNFSFLPRKLWGEALWWILLLSVAPILVGIGETLQREFPETDPFFGFIKVNPFHDIILPSVTLPIMVMGCIGWLIVFIPTRQTFIAWSLFAKLATIGVLAVLEILALWLGILWAHWTVISRQSYYWNQLWGPPYPNPETWVLVIGVFWTMGISLATAHIGKRLIQ